MPRVDKKLGIRTDGRWATCNKKGQDGEEAVARALGGLFPGAKAVGFKTQRRTGSAGPDVEGTPYWVEVERSEAPRPFRKMRQAQVDGASDPRPKLVVSTRTDDARFSGFRVPGMETLVTMTLNDFLALQAKATS